MDKLERESIKDEMQTRKISVPTIIGWIFGVGIALMALAYLGGFLTTGGLGGKQGSGIIINADSAATNKVDSTTIK